MIDYRLSAVLLLAGFTAMMPPDAAQAQASSCVSTSVLGDWSVFSSLQEPKISNLKGEFFLAPAVTAANVAINILAEKERTNANQPERMILTVQIQDFRYLKTSINVPKTKFQIFKLAPEPALVIGDAANQLKLRSVDWVVAMANRAQESDLIAWSDTGQVTLGITFQRPDDPQPVVIGKFTFSSKGLKDAFAKLASERARIGALASERKCR